MTRLMVILFVVTIIFAGCAPEEAPAEPTPDLQIQMQTKLDLGQWFVNSQYLAEISSEAADKIDAAINNSGENARLNVSAIIEKYSESDGLISKFNSLQDKLEAEYGRLNVIPEKDNRLFASLEKCNFLTGKLIALVSKAPKAIEDFAENRQKLQDQLDSLYKILLIEFPESSDELSALHSKENPDYKAISKLVNDLPKPKDDATPTPDITIPTATPTLPPARKWIDENGILHMGQKPPENANLLEIKSNLSGSIDISAPEDHKSEPATASESTIWVDENGVTHMGSNVPEGVEGKPAREIPLMIGD